ncbi:MAG TPA: glycoside hydrolase family 15 protein [Candidatus Eisenbacteria bacterium]|nr:glycoside hydrolase family 15 protein [Candidatus Eisenbacteria bacterium]
MRVGGEVGRYTLARAILAGNGSLLATSDRFGSLRELYAPFVSPEHQLLRRPARIAVAIDGAVHWLEDRFESRLGDGGDAPIADLALASEDLALEIWIEIVADAHRNVLIRRVQLTNRSGSHRDARLLFHHDLRLQPAGGGEPNETARLDPVASALIHQSGRRVAMIGLETSSGAGVPIWKVAERGADTEPGAEALGPGARLEGPSQAHGRVDSIVGAAMALAPGASSLVSTWIAVSDSVRGARAIEESLRGSGVGGALGATRSYWSLWIGQGARDLPDLPEDVLTLYHRSLALVRLHQMPEGAIVSGVEPPDAAGEPGSGRPARSEARVCRHRDAAQAADALGRAGYTAHTRRYLEHAARVAAEHGLLPSETDATGAPAGGRLDPAGLALAIWALARHFERERDAEFLGDAYRSLVTAGADTLASTLDPETQLPPGPDLWGERHGLFASNASMVRAGLLAAARLAAALGESARARAWAGAADRIARSMTRHLLLPEWGRFARSVAREGRGVRADATVDASLLTLGLWGEMEPEDARVRATVDAVRETLWVKTGTGGIARYERDPLHSVGSELAEVPGSPSIAATLWLATHAIRVARKTQDLDAARTLLLWCAARAEGWSGLPEQLHPYRGETRSACPSLLAHTWLVGTVADYAERLRILKRCDRCGAPASSGRGRRGLALPDPLTPGLVAHAQG